MPKLRMEAVRLVKHQGWSTRKVARYTGFNQSVIVKWCRRDVTGGWCRIPTRSSRPNHHPAMLRPEMVQAIVAQRQKHHRCAEVIHQELANDGIRVSLCSIKRILDRKGLTKKRSIWKRYHPHVDRPEAINPGDLVQIDTVHIMKSEKKRIYICTLIDVCSRWSYAKAYPVLNGAVTVAFIREAETMAGFPFSIIQSDHGPEFSRYFVARVGSHRFSRIGKPNDNSHIERFNRTIQEECLDRLPRDVNTMNRELKGYLKYYNHERLHMGINLLTPIQLIPSY